MDEIKKQIEQNGSIGGTSQTPNYLKSPKDLDKDEQRHKVRIKADNLSTSMPYNKRSYAKDFTRNYNKTFNTLANFEWDDIVELNKDYNRYLNSGSGFFQDVANAHIKDLGYEDINEWNDDMNFDGWDEYDNLGYDNEGYNMDGYNENGFHKNGIHQNGTRYDKYGYDVDGYDKEGYDQYDYDREGYDKEGYNEDGYDRNGKYKYDEPKEEDVLLDIEFQELEDDIDNDDDYNFDEWFKKYY